MASLAVLLLRRDAKRATGAVFLTSRSVADVADTTTTATTAIPTTGARLFQVAASAAPPAAARSRCCQRKDREADCDDSYAAGGLPDSYAAGGLPDYWMQKQGEHAWLEEVLGEKALGWVKDENAKTVAALGNPAASPLSSRILGILTSRKRSRTCARSANSLQLLGRQREPARSAAALHDGGVPRRPPGRRGNGLGDGAWRGQAQRRGGREL